MKNARKLYKQMMEQTCSSNKKKKQHEVKSIEFVHIYDIMGMGKMNEWMNEMEDPYSRLIVA